jgi:hypothetical protein
MFKRAAITLSIIAAIGATIIPLNTQAHSNPNDKKHIIKPTPHHQPKIQLAIKRETNFGK